MFPADLPAVDDADLRLASQQLLSSLQSRPHAPGQFQSSPTVQVAITAGNIIQLQLFEDDQPECPVLALHPPDQPTQVVAVYLHRKWWHVDDVLRTSSESRSGLVSVSSLMERLIVFLLSQVVERPSEGAGLFSRHPPTEHAQLLWSDGRAVGFYTVKRKGALCERWSGGGGYQLPVLDTLLVRSSCRRRGFGLRMLHHFCSFFPGEEVLGVSAPLSAGMAAVCRRFLQLHQDHRERLYEVEAPGGWTQRRNIWLGLQLGRYPRVASEERRPASGGAARAGAHESSRQTLKIKTCDPSREERSSSTGDTPAGRARDPDPGPPARPPESLDTKRAAEPGEAHSPGSKRVRRT